MLATVVMVVLVANYAYETMRNRRARQRLDPDPAVSVTLESAVYGGGPIAPALRAANRRVFEPSAIVEVEHQRRATLAAFGLAVIGGFVWLVFAEPMDAVIARVASVTPLAVGLPLIAVLIAVVWARQFTHSIVGPSRNVRLAAASVLGSLIGCALFAASPALLGA
ncbi:MAG TPA: hypothetical protein VE011_11390 [Candidatus Dormibacteraeota bacterium]|nr:hypothetical protein [Candidatus Dormibacteraeota bacterium]